MKTKIFILLVFTSICANIFAVETENLEQNEAKQWLYDEILLDYKHNTQYLYKNFLECVDNNQPDIADWYLKRYLYRQHIYQVICLYDANKIEFLLEYIKKYDDIFYFDVLSETDAFANYFEVFELDF